MPRRSQLQPTDTVRFSGDIQLRPGPVVVALDDEDRPLGVSQVDVLTTLGGLKAFSKAKKMYKNAATLVPGIASACESGKSEGYQIRICNSDSHTEKQWWDELLLWAAHKNGLVRIDGY